MTLNHSSLRKTRHSLFIVDIYLRVHQRHDRAISAIVPVTTSYIK